jgi:lysyl-tRNA synthetase class 2
MIRYRQSRLKETLRTRADAIGAIRRFFQERGYLEVETPIRIPAPAPEAHIDAVSSENWYLQTSPELCMKFLLAAGYERIFQVARCFRSGERGQKHIPELTMLEWYTAGQDYRAMMDQTAELVRFVARNLKRGETLAYGGRRIDCSGAWKKLRVDEAFTAHSETTVAAALEDGTFDDIMGVAIEPRLGWKQPVFLYDYPAGMGALAKLKADDTRWAERFELYIAGLELCNGFSELTDPAEQRQRFEAELDTRRALGKVSYPMPEKFLEVLADMPAAAGNALGVDRLVMLLTDSDHIDDVVAFTPEELLP